MSPELAILGRLDGVMTGIRQLRRTRPLETEIVSGLRVPTLAEMARIKAWLLATRHTVRDYLDTVVLLERLGEPGARAAFASFDELYGQDSGASPLVEVLERLAAAAPSDAPEVDLRTYKGLVTPWNDWSHLSGRGRQWAAALAVPHLSGAAGERPCRYLRSRTNGRGLEPEPVGSRQRRSPGPGARSRRPRRLEGALPVGQPR